MKSLNYFFYMHGGILLILTVGIAFVVCMLAALFAHWLGKQLALSGVPAKILIYLCVFIALAGSFFIPGMFRGRHDQGGVKKLFISDAQEPVKLTVWLTRIHSKRVGANYDQRIKTFDLDAGTALGMAEMAHRHINNDYYIYWTSGKHAWGFSSEAGIQYLDLATPRVVSQNEIMQLIPQLRSGFQMVSDYRLDPVTHGLRIVTRRGERYQITPDLKLAPVSYDHGAPRQVPRKKWIYEAVTGSLGLTLHARDTRPSPESKILLKPEFIEELNPEVTFKSSRWIAHVSALYGKGEPLISYIAADGHGLNEIHITRIMNSKARVIATYTGDNYVYIFLSSGDTLFGSIYGFTLMSLKTSIETGKILKQIHYF